MHYAHFFFFPLLDTPNPAPRTITIQILNRTGRKAGQILKTRIPLPSQRRNQLHYNAVGTGLTDHSAFVRRLPLRLGMGGTYSPVLDLDLALALLLTRLAPGRLMWSAGIQLSS